MENTVTIPRVEYDELLIDKYKLENIRVLAVKDDCKYGYSDGTTKIIDVLLGIERKEKAD